MTATCLFASFIGVIVALDNYWDEEETLATFDCGHGREIVITTARAWEVNRSVYYSVRVNGNNVVDSTFVDAFADVDAISFTLHAHGLLHGITEGADESAKTFLIIHDFEDNSSWPSGEHHPWDLRLSVEENNRIRQESRSQLESRLRSLQKKESVETLNGT